MKTKLKIKQEKGITLIALVVTIVVLLILAGVSISLVLNNNGLISKAKDAKNSTEKGQAQDEVNLAINYLQIEDATSTLTREDKRKILEDELRKISADSSVSISGSGYKITHKKYDFFVDEDLKISSSGKTFDAVEWDKKAAPEDVFIWKSDDPNNADYGVIIGYKKNVDNYTILRFPSRCTKISTHYSYDVYKDYEDDEPTVRSYTKNILKVEMPDTITELGDGAFSGERRSFYFSSLERVELSKSLSKIEEAAFSGCENLNDIEIPDNIVEISSSAFDGCTNLQQINLPEELEKIGGWVFKGCRALESITIPENVKEIGGCCFEDCTSLQQINLPDGLEKIGFRAFTRARNLSEIIIPESVKTIGEFAFDEWSSKQTIKCKATKAGDNWDYYWNHNSGGSKFSANIIWGYQDNNT